MSRSPYATISALSVPCPALDMRPNGTLASCGSPAGQPCVDFEGHRRARVHSVRRKAADEKRTAEVKRDTVEIPPEIPIREYAPPRIPDLCPDDTRDAPHNPETCMDPGCDCMPF